MNFTINKKDISFVVQGPIVLKDNQTYKCLNSIRKFFPQSKIILSTWKDSELSKLDFDEVILSNDPGAKYLSFNNYMNNINRMIISSKAGILKARTKFTVKLRTDMLVINSNLATLLSSIENKKGLFKSKIIIPSNWSKNPDYDEKMLFHPSDFLYAGLTDDLRDLFSLPLMNESDMTWFLHNQIPKNAAIPSFIPRYSNEQYIFISFLNKKKFMHGINHAFDYSKKSHEAHNKFFLDNLVLKHAKNIGVNCQKYPYKWPINIKQAYTEQEALNLDPKVNKIDWERIYFKIITLIKTFLRAFEYFTLGFFKKFFLKK